MTWQRPDRTGEGKTGLMRVIATALLSLLISGAEFGVMTQDVTAQEWLPTENATVIARGAALMSRTAVAWRALESTAPPAVQAEWERRSLGFVIAGQDPLVVTTGIESEPVHLAAGDAVFVPNNADQRRASGGRRSGTYDSIELIDAALTANNNLRGDTNSLVVSDPFVAPPGRRELDLVRGDLQPGESARLLDTGTETLILGTSGTVRVTLTGDGGSFLLGPAVAATFAGEADVRAIGSERGTFVAALIGPEAAPGTGHRGLPTTRPPSGVIALRPFICPPGWAPRDADPTACESAPNSLEMELFVIGTGDHRRIWNEAAYADGEFIWFGLPEGEYLLKATGFAPGYDRFVMFGLKGINAPPERGYTDGPNEGYLVPLAASADRYRLNVYVFTAAPANTDLGIWVHVCPPGVVARPVMADLGCELMDPFPVGFDLALSGDSLPFARTLASTVPGDAGAWVWPDVPFGDYVLTATLPARFSGYAVRPTSPGLPIALLADSTGYSLTLSPELFDPGAEYRRTNIDVYLLQA